MITPDEFGKVGSPLDSVVGRADLAQLTKSNHRVDRTESSGELTSHNYKSNHRVDRSEQGCQVLRSTGLRLEDDYIAHLYKQFDADGSGGMDFVEFADLMCSDGEDEVRKKHHLSALMAARRCFWCRCVC